MNMEEPRDTQLRVQSVPNINQERRSILSSSQHLFRNRSKNCRTTRSLTRVNSTSSLYLSNVMMYSADAMVLSKCLSKVVYYEVLSNRQDKCNSDIFNEKIHPLDKQRIINFDQPPSLSDVEELITNIFSKQVLSAECAVLAVAYIDKIGSSRKTKLCPANWRRVLLSALLLSEKVYEDQAVWNIDYAKSFPEISVDDLRQLEREFLIKIQFELTLKPSEYAKYYFELVSRRDKNEYPLHQLDRNTATTLEAKAIGCVKKSKISVPSPWDQESVLQPIHPS